MKKIRGMAAKASIRIENNTIKKREFTLVKIIIINFLHKIGLIFVTMKNLYLYHCHFLQQPCYYF